MVLLAFALNNLSLAQFAKLPVLVEHFKEHKLRDAEITFIDFLAMHYWGKDIDDDDDSRDKQLPFKDQHIPYSFYNHYTPPNNIQISVPVVPIINTHPQLNQFFSPDAHLGALFRPPQA